MSESDRTFAELVGANPIPPGTDPHREAEGEAAVLDVIEARSARETWARSSPAPGSLPLRAGWLVAAAAFAIVLLAVGVIAAVTFANRGGDAVDPISTTIPTTQAAPTTSNPAMTEAPTTSLSTTSTLGATTTTAPIVDPTTRSAIDAFVATFNSGDTEATLAALSPDALVWSSVIAGTFTSEEPLPLADFGPLIERWLRYLAVQQTEIILESCEVIEEERVNCQGTFSDLVVRTSPLPPASLSATFAVTDGGKLSYLFLRENEPTMNGAYELFGLWLSAKYPGEDEILYDGTGRPSFFDEALTLWATRVAEWIQEQ